MFRHSFLTLTFITTASVTFCASQASVVQEYKQELAQEYQTLKANFFYAAGISEADWQQALIRYKPLYDQQVQELRLKNAGSVSESLKNTVRMLLQKCNISPSSIEIVANSSKIASTRAPLMLLSEIGLNSLDIGQDSKEAIILHEIMHIMYQDSLEHFCAYQLLTDLESQSCSWYNSWYNNSAWLALNKLEQFHERRADLMAGLMDARYAKGLADYFNVSRCEAQHPYSEWQERVVYMMKLYSKMVAQNS